MMPYFELADKKRFTKHAVKYFCGKYPQIKKKQVIAAVEEAYLAQDEYYIDVRIEGQRAIRYADEHDLDVAVIAGRPYHVDPEINHGIDQLIASFGSVLIVSEDAVWQLTGCTTRLHVLEPVDVPLADVRRGPICTCTQKENAQLVQLVSFGCGIDAITTDEMRAILRKRRQDLHPAENRRDQQPRGGENPYPQPAWPPWRPGTEACSNMAERLRQRPAYTVRLQFTKEMAKDLYHSGTEDAARCSFDSCCTACCKKLRLQRRAAATPTGPIPLLEEGLK